MGGLRRGSHAPPASCSACHCFPGASVAAAGLPRAGHQLDRGGVHAILDAELVGGCAGGQSAQHRLFLPQRTIAPDCTQAAGGCMTLGRVPIGNAAWRSVTASRRTCYPCPKMAPRNPEQPPGTEPGGWLRRGGVGVAASDNPPTTAPSGGSPSSPASSRAPVRPPRTPPHPSHTCARSYLNPPFLLLTCAHHLAPCLCACACAQFAPFSGRIRALTNSGDAGSASDGAVRDDRLFAAHGACYARPLRTHPACRAFCCPPHLPACIHSQHVLI